MQLVFVFRFSPYPPYSVLKIELSDEEIKYLEEPYVPRPVAGHW
jgi:hypothetical protein